MLSIKKSAENYISLYALHASVIVLDITIRPRRVHVPMLVFLSLPTNYMLRVNINLTIEYMTTEADNDNYVDWISSQQEDMFENRIGLETLLV